jgi:hypothetical protein
MGRKLPDLRSFFLFMCAFLSCYFTLVVVNAILLFNSGYFAAINTVIIAVLSFILTYPLELFEIDYKFMLIILFVNGCFWGTLLFIIIQVMKKVKRL